MPRSRPASNPISYHKHANPPSLPSRWLTGSSYWSVSYGHSRYAFRIVVSTRGLLWTCHATERHEGGRRKAKVFPSKVLPEHFGRVKCTQRGSDIFTGIAAFSWGVGVDEYQP